MYLNGKIAIYVSAILLVVIYGTAGTYILGRSGNFNIKVTSIGEALYFTIVTTSTVGYGDIVPTTNLGRAFVIVLIIAGLTIFLSAVTVLSSDFLGARIEKMYGSVSIRERRKLKNHIILVGFDLTNAHIAERLREEKRNFIIITADKTVADGLRVKGYNAHVADYTLRSDMEKFEIGKASDVIVDLRDNSKTIYVVLVIRKLSSRVRLSVVAQDRETEVHLADLHIDNIINPITIAADMLTEIIKKGPAGEKGV